MIELIKLKLGGARRSLTVWFNAVMLAALPVVEIAKDALPELQQYLTPTVYKYVGLAVVVVNIGLRFRTSKPLEAK